MKAWSGTFSESGLSYRRSNREVGLAIRVSGPDEAAWLELARAGDRAAVERLVECYQDSIYSIAMTFTRNHHQAEDLAQEAWIRALKGLSGFRGESRFTTWLYRVVMNTFLNAPRPRETAYEESAVERDELGRRETGLMVQQAVRALPDEFRSVIALRFIADLSYAEIAAALQIPLGTVQSRLSRGLERLAAELR
ncbi:sigma-70 family RNA polymerase sigma factor [bacterium CPR1]|nr:sigma-70 family RNA polymerase sigma factor [bacterium CPR1]